MHLTAAADGTGRYRAERKGGFEIRPGGNAVSLEEQMMKVASNQMDFQEVATLYRRSLNLLKTAMGRGE
jgi:flagellar basal-body rod protein FlgB